MGLLGLNDGLPSLNASIAEVHVAECACAAGGHAGGVGFRSQLI